MFVLVTGEGGAVRATVEDAQNLKRLHMELRGVDDEAAAEALRTAGLGRIDGEQAWLNAEALKVAEVVDNSAKISAEIVVESRSAAPCLNPRGIV